MKLKNLVGLVFGCVILSVTVAHALYAENGNKNYRNGQYDQAIQNYNTALSNGENSEQTYSTQVSKNNYMQPQKPQYEKKFGYGFIYLKDPYNNKFFVLQVINDSPAYKAGLRIGDELVKKDGEKLKKYSRRELSNLLANTNSGTFEIKNRSGEQIISITKAYVNLPVEKFENPHRDKYWNQRKMGIKNI